MFDEGETPTFVGKAVAGLASDPDCHKMNGRIVLTVDLAKKYGFREADGRLILLPGPKLQYFRQDTPKFEEFKAPARPSRQPAGQMDPGLDALPRLATVDEY